MKFKLRVEGREYTMTLTPATLMVLMQTAQFSILIPDDKTEYKNWERQCNRNWRLLLENCIRPSPRPEDEPILFFALINAGGRLIQKAAEIQVSEVENS